MRTPASSLVIVLLLAAASGSVAQDKGTLKPHALPPLANPDDPKTPAKELFGRKVSPTAAQPHVVGFYASGCLAGAVALPINGEACATATGAIPNSSISSRGSGPRSPRPALGGACWSATCRSRAVGP